MADVLCERDGHVATITMNRPERYNAISPAMLSDLGVMLKECDADRAVRVVILSAGLILAEGAGIVDVELLEPAVYLLAGLSVITVVQRIWHVRRELTLVRAPDSDFEVTT